MKKLSELDLNELTRRRNTLKSSFIAFVILGVLVVLVLIFLKAPLVSFIPAMVLPITWLPLFTSLKEIDAEIKSRNL
ncbi:MAG TPA: hypothetical protein VIT44_18335 [Cyclobacteriaceae bacterium]